MFSSFVWVVLILLVSSKTLYMCVNVCVRPPTESIYRPVLSVCENVSVLPPVGAEGQPIMQSKKKKKKKFNQFLSTSTGQQLKIQV